MNKIIATGILGLVAAIAVGVGEYLLHYDPLARFGEGFEFFRGISAERTTLGHFYGVFGATLYLVGCYHIYLMLRPANERLAFSAFLLGAFGFIIGAVWIGSRASISALMQLPESDGVNELIVLYELRYETLLWVVRLTTLGLSLIFIALTLTGKSHYPKWMALCSPIVLLLSSFVLYLIAPEVGKHFMPIALNVGFFLFFALSLLQARKI